MPPRPVPARTGLWVALGIALAALTAWQLSLGAHAGALTQLCVNAVTIMVPAVAFVIKAYRSRRDARLGPAWRWIAVAMVCTFGGYLVQIGYQIGTGSTPYPSVADALFLLFYPTLFVGVMRFPTRPHAGSERLRLALDIGTISLCGASVVWELVLRPTLTAGGAPTGTELVSDAYPTADLLIIFGLTRLLVRGVPTAVRRPAQLIGLGMVATVVGDIIYTWSALHSGELNGSVSTIIYALGDVCFLGAAVAQPPGSGSGEADDAPRLRARGIVALPYLAPVALLALQLHAQFGDSTLSRVTLTIAAAALLVLLTARHLTVQRDLATTVSLVTSTTEQLRYQALHDALTGLPNRALILDRVEGALARARRRGTAVGVMFIDLDGFKRINDTYGHATGDELLSAVSLRLAAALRESDTIGRLGGDEFVILLESDSPDLGAERIADRVRDALAEPFQLGEDHDHSVVARASIGIAVGLRVSADELLRDADVALYAAKDAGKDRYVLFAHKMQAAVQERLRLEMDLRAAIGTEQFFVVYQPTVNLRTGAITGTEALLRWEHPVRGLVMPDEFIPLAEEIGLIVPLGRWVLGEACRQTALWNRDGRGLSVAVNVSGRQLEDDIDLIADVAAAIETSGIAPDALVLEVTESILVRDIEASAHRLRMLKGLGVKIAIDDFGTGYSSIAYLQRFTVDTLKIDRTFVSTIATTPEADALVHTLVQLGLALGLETCAEGIEDDVQLQALRREGCDSGQGYLFARPLDPHNLEAFLTATSTGAIPWASLMASAP